MYSLLNLFENPNIRTLCECGPFKVIEYTQDLSNTKMSAIYEYYASQMNVHKRQLVCTLNGANKITLQPGAMQWMAGQVQMVSGVKGVGDAVGKIFKGAVTGERMAKPEYTGTGVVCTEPTYKHIILLDLSKFGGAVMIEDGMFFACSENVNLRVVPRNTVSSAIAGGAGLFNLVLEGTGIVALESYVPYEELMCVRLENDVLKVDGNLAVFWTPSLQFTVERSSQTLIGSAASGEGLVNVYRGSGYIYLTPVANSISTAARLME